MLADLPAAETSSRRTARAYLPEGTATVLTAFVASRLMVFGVIVLSRLQVPQGHFSVPGGVLNVLSSGPAAAYVGMVQSGSWVPFAPGSATGFFPVFPVLLKVLALLFGNIALAGVVLSNAALLAAGMLLYRLLQTQYDDLRVSRTAVMLLMFTPASYFLTGAVPDATALALALGSMLAATRGRWIVASVCALLLCGTINAGYWIVVPLTFEYLRQGRSSGTGENRLLRRDFLPFALAFVPLAAALMFGLLNFNDPLALLKLSSGSEHRLDSILRLSHYFEGYASFCGWMFRGALLASTLLCVAGFLLKVRSGYVAFAVVLTAACFWSHDLQAPRTLTISFPLFAIMGVLAARFPALYEPLLTGSMVLLTLFTVVAANGFWIS